MLELAQSRGKGAMVGSQASTTIGTARAAAFAALAGVDHPCELAFFLKLDAEIVDRPLEIRNGRLRSTRRRGRDRRGAARSSRLRPTRGRGRWASGERRYVPPSSSDRCRARCTACSKISRQPFCSRNSIAAWVVPPGDVTRARSSAGPAGSCDRSSEAPTKVW